MVVNFNCEDVWREVSNYLDGDVAPDLRAAIEHHVRGCERCAAVVEGTRNIVQLYGDDRMLEVPLGFSQRLHSHLHEKLDGQTLHEANPVNRRTFMGWAAAAAAALLIGGGIELSRPSRFQNPGSRSQLAQSAKNIPPTLQVVASEEGKLFHLAGCDFIRGKNNLRTMTAAVAIHDGYAPCTRCLKKYLT
jgi:Putative zinc-finger/TAT (twin-arginine translocation) pathway signal sequence